MDQCLVDDHLLLLQFLQEFVYYKDAECLLLRVQDVQINQNATGFVWRARAAGAPIKVATQMLGADVKGVTCIVCKGCTLRTAGRLR